MINKIVLDTGKYLARGHEVQISSQIFFHPTFNHNQRMYIMIYFQLPPVRAVLGGLSRVSKENEPASFTSSGADEHSDHGNDIEQFGQLIATLLGHCHGSSEYVEVRLSFDSSITNR